jgi:hypothetical protein
MQANEGFRTTEEEEETARKMSPQVANSRAGTGSQGGNQIGFSEQQGEMFVQLPTSGSSLDWAQEDLSSQLYAPARVFPSGKNDGTQLDMHRPLEIVLTAAAATGGNPITAARHEGTSMPTARWQCSTPHVSTQRQPFPPSITVASMQQFPAVSNVLWMREQMYTLQTNTQEQSHQQQVMLDTTIRTARPFDILLGRGKAHRKHLGNVRMQFVADMYRETYLNASARESKSDISTAIVQMLKACTGRFLQFDKGLQAWVQVTDEAAIKKIGHAIRDGRSRELGRIDPSVLQDLLPLIPDHIRCAALQPAVMVVPTNSSAAHEGVPANPVAAEHEYVNALLELFPSSSSPNSQPDEV